MTKKTKRIPEGRAVLIELQNLDGRPCRPEVASCCLRILASIHVQEKKLRRELNDALDMLGKTLHINREYPPMKAARASLKE